MASNLYLQEGRPSYLSKDNITLHPADKGRCTMVLNTMYYHEKMAAFLSEKNTYKTLTLCCRQWDHTSDCLQVVKTINRPTKYRLCPRKSTPCIYRLWKIHRDGIPFGFIVANITGTTYNTAKCLFLAPLLDVTSQLQTSLAKLSWNQNLKRWSPALPSHFQYLEGYLRPEQMRHGFSISFCGSLQGSHRLWGQPYQVHP